MLGRLIVELERVSSQMAELDKILAQQALDDPRARRRMTIPGISSVVASTVLALDRQRVALSDRAETGQLFGLTPKVRQSGDQHARHGRISSRATAMPARCSWRQPGEQRRHLALSGRSLSGFRKCVVLPLRPWRQPVSSP
jgi:transposase